MGPAQRGLHAGRLRRQMDRSLKRGRRLVEVFPLLLNHTQHPVGGREVRVQLDRVIGLFEGGLEVVPEQVNQREVARHDRGDGIERLRLQHLVERLVQASQRHQAGHRVPMVGRRIGGIEADRELELAVGALPVPVLRGLHVRQGGMRFGGTGVEHDRRRGAGGRFRPDFGRSGHAVVRQKPVSIGQAAVGERILAVLDDGALEEVDSLAETLLGPLIQVIAALEAQVAGGEILGQPAAAKGAGRAVRLELLDDGVRDRLLRGEIGGRRIEGLRPGVRAARAIDEMSGHAELVSDRRTLPVMTIAARAV